MAYVRKTKDVWHIVSNYGYGWETESTYDTLEEAKHDLSEYRLAVSRHFGVCKIVKGRKLK